LSQPARAVLIALARAANTAFFFLTSVVCLLTYSPFTYEQFIKPRVSPQLYSFAVWHVAFFSLMLSITALTLAPFLERSRRQWIGWAYLAASVALGVWFFTHPLWLLDGKSRASLILAVVATLPPIWLAVFDHVAASSVRPVTRGIRDSGFGIRAPNPESPIPNPVSLVTNDSRTWTTAWGTAVFAFAVYAVAVPLRLRLTGGLGGVTLPRVGMLLGWGVSALAHLTVFTLVGLVLMVVAGLAALTRSPGRTQYALLGAVSVMMIALTLVRVMLAPIGIRGPAAWLVAIATGVALASAWSGVARHRVAAAFGSEKGPSPFFGGDNTKKGYGPFSALDAWLAPITTGRSRLAPAIGLVVAPLAIHFVIARVATFDWEFMLQKLATLALWLVAFGFIHALTRDPRTRRPLWLAPVVVLALFAAEQVLLPRLPAVVRDQRLNPEFALDAYAAVDPSFRIARDMLGSGATGDTAEFFAYLRANATIESPHIDPVDIDVVQTWTRSTGRPPNVFLFIIDSLRPDYVSPYNKAAQFTPAIQAFAGDSFVFTRAFSRYAGTGLSVPSIWAGAMLIHKQYVTPFASMNALEKLVSAKGYRRFITEDHIADELFSASPATVGLDHHVIEMLHTFCRTMGELDRHLEHLPNGPPVFAMTRPLDLHVQNIASVKVPPGESYPGFHPPYASRVRRIDACFGEFIETLKRTHMYDNSIVVLTSDHGDSLGEGQRWGHGYTAFPEVLRIPLIIHVPPLLAGRLSADLGRLSFSTDITPTLYALLGEPPSTEGPRGVRDLLRGSPLLADSSTDFSWRRRESYLVASSYGPVFGLLGHNGRRLYLADAVEAREYAYDLRSNGTDVRVGITDAEREASRKAIRQQIDEIAAWYRFAPEP
jgi:hypothetical protein